MCCGSAFHTALSHDSPLARDAFLADAQCNLALMREVFGTDSWRYHRLAQQYLAVADVLGCRREVERLLPPLPRGRTRQMEASPPTG